MKRFPVFVAALLWMAALLSGCASTRVDPSAVEAFDISRRPALALVNDFRARNNLKPLRINEQLMQAAAWQTAAMATKNEMDHAVAGALPSRVARFGYDWSTLAENIGRNYRDYDAAMAGWINSPGHRKNLLNPNITEIGFAGGRMRSGGSTYWTQIFGAPSQAPSQVVAQTPMRWGPELRFP